MGNLIALGQVGVEIILAVEVGDGLQLGAHGRREEGSLLHHSLVKHRQYSGQPRANRADVGVRAILPGIQPCKCKRSCWLC